MRNAANLSGNTPIIQVPYEGNTLHLKIEGSNPGLSIKDRVAFHICDTLDRTVGLLGKSVVEYSSGNLAIGLAQASKIWNFDLALVVTSKTSPDKLKLLKRFGAELIMVDESLHSEDPRGFRGFASIIAGVRNSIFIDQFNNKLNPEAHYKSIGPEIVRAVSNADYVFSPLGTGGTASGIAQYLKDTNHPAEVIGVTPDAGIYYTHYHGISEQRRSADHTIIEGVGEDFIPGNLKMGILGNIIEVRDAIALREVDTLLESTGIFVGGTSGLALAGAKQFIDSNKLRSKNVVVLCPDSGNRYLSASDGRRSEKESVYQTIVDQYRDGEYPKIV